MRGMRPVRSADDLRPPPLDRTVQLIVQLAPSGDAIDLGEKTVALYKLFFLEYSESEKLFLHDRWQGG